jgi:hypothetical protein
MASRIFGPKGHEVTGGQKTFHRVDEMGEACGMKYSGYCLEKLKKRETGGRKRRWDSNIKTGTIQEG